MGKNISTCMDRKEWQKEFFIYICGLNSNNANIMVWRMMNACRYKGVNSEENRKKDF